MDELKSHNEQLQLLKGKSTHGPVTLLFAAKDEQHNEAVILEKLLKPR
jgi:uncharacterized protein YeaO (DUF488 family)